MLTLPFRINSNMHLSIAFFLGFAEVIATHTHDRGIRISYKSVFWFEVALAIIALVIMLIWVRVDKAKCDLTADEKEMERERSRLRGDDHE